MSSVLSNIMSVEQLTRVTILGGIRWYPVFAGDEFKKYVGIPTGPSDEHMVVAHKADSKDVGIQVVRTDNNGDTVISASATVDSRSAQDLMLALCESSLWNSAKAAKEDATRVLKRIEADAPYRKWCDYLRAGDAVLYVTDSPFGSRRFVFRIGAVVEGSKLRRIYMQMAFAAGRDEDKAKGIEYVDVPPDFDGSSLVSSILRNPCPDVEVPGRDSAEDPNVTVSELILNSSDTV